MEIFLSSYYYFFLFCCYIHYTKNVLHKLFIQPLCYIQFCEKLSNNFPKVRSPGCFLFTLVIILRGKLFLLSSFTDSFIFFILYSFIYFHFRIFYNFHFISSNHIRNISNEKSLKLITNRF
jgi:hypothetical protein